MAHRLEITINEDTLRRLDAARGFEKRASFVKRALESALGSRPVEPVPDVGRADRAGGPEPITRSTEPVSSRTPDEPVAKVLGSNVRKTPSLKETWGR